MKFGKELQAATVQAWKDKYVRFEEIKAQIKELKKLYEEHDITMARDDGAKSPRATPMPIPSPIRQHSKLNLQSLPMGNMTGNSNSNRHSSSRQRLSLIKLDAEAKDDHSHDEEQNAKKAKNANAKEISFEQVTSVIEPDLDRKVPSFPAELFDIKSKEMEIVLMIEQDMFTVSKFYAQQCRYFAEQRNALIIRIEVMVKNMQMLSYGRRGRAHTTKSGDDDDDDDENDVKPSPQRSASDDEKADEEEEETVDELDDDRNDDDLSKYRDRLSAAADGKESKDITMKDILNEKSYLRLLFRQIYHALQMLEQYRSINQTAFRKISKKHDKNSPRFKNLKKYATVMVDGSNFGTDAFTMFMRTELESLYSEYLRPSNQSRGEAVERIRHPPSQKKIQNESCVIGLCGGWSVAIFLISALLVLTAQGKFWDSLSTYRSWYIFRASFLLSVYLWLWGCDLWVFQKYQFNHAFIFGADPTTLMRVPHVWTTAAIFSVTTMLFTIFYVLAFVFPDVFRVDPEIFAVAGLGCWFLYMVLPFPSIKYTKRFLCKSFLKQVISPFSTVQFIDFFLADQWTSLFTLVVDLSFSFCYAFTTDFLLDGDTQSACDNNTTKAILSLLRAFPYHIRFWQCIRRVWDQKGERPPTKWRWHAANAGKYSFALITVFINALHIYFGSQSTEILSVVFGVVTTLYAYCWDIYKDWGLLRWGANKHHKCLRRRLTYPVVTYYAAMVINFAFRVSWAVSLYPVSFGMTDLSLMHYVALGLNVIEVIRRCMWNVFRIENEHLNNCGEFRVVHDIPIAQDYANAIKVYYDDKQVTNSKLLRVTDLTVMTTVTEANANAQLQPQLEHEDDPTEVVMHSIE